MRYLLSSGTPTAFKIALHLVPKSFSELLPFAHQKPTSQILSCLRRFLPRRCVNAILALEYAEQMHKIRMEIVRNLCRSEKFAQLHAARKLNYASLRPLR